MNEFDLYEKFCSRQFKEISDQIKVLDAKLEKIDAKLDGRLRKVENFQNKITGVIIFINAIGIAFLKYFRIGE